VVKLNTDSGTPFFLTDQLDRFNADFYDARLQSFSSTIIQVIDGQPTQASQYMVSGVGVRVLRDGLWGFSSTSKLDKESLVSACVEADNLAGMSKKRKLCLSEMKPVTGKYITEAEQPSIDVPIEDKLDRLIEFEKHIKELDDRVKSAHLRYSDSVDRVTILNSEGSNVVFVQPHIDISINIVVNDGTKSQHTRGRESAIGGYEFFENPCLVETAQATVKRAIDLLSAKKAPSGKMMVAMDPSVTGLFLHEAFGHSAEADSVLQGRSFLAGKIGENVASDIATVYSDPTLPGNSGSYPFDSEAVPAVKKPLIEKGVFKSYMHDRTTAAAYGVESTSNGRAEDYGKPPIVRMNNLYFEPGDASLDEIIEETRDGVFLVAGGGGLEDPERGRFQFSVQNCYEIKDGEIGAPLRGTSISGWTIEAMRSIDMMSNHLSTDVGSCGKGEPIMQIVPVGNGGPYLRLSNIMLGG